MALFVLQMGDVLWKLEFALQLQDEGKPAAGGKVYDAYVSHNAATLDNKEEILGIELDDSSSSHSFLKLLTQKEDKDECSCNFYSLFVVEKHFYLCSDLYFILLLTMHCNF